MRGIRINYFDIVFMILTLMSRIILIKTKSMVVFIRKGRRLRLPIILILRKEIIHDIDGLNALSQGMGGYVMVILH